jgi:tricorn protease
MSYRTVRRLLTAAIVVLFLVPVAAEAQTKLLRFPDIHGERIVFTYAGDLWTVPANGGTATRLTAHPGVEFSPDGQWIAFTGQYDGDEQVYVMPATGGEPRQLTYYPAPGPLPHRWGYDNVVYGWTIDGTGILFRSLRDGAGIAEGRLFTVSADGGLPEALPMPMAGAGELLPGDRVVYSPLFRDFRNWKRYEGGWAQDLWMFDLDTHEAYNFTNDPRTDRDPMLVGDRVYFVSDRTGTLNIYAFDPQSEQTSAVTSYADADVRWPSSDGEGRIVFELDGELRVLDAASGDVRDVVITVPDDALAARATHMDVSGYLEDFELSPKGERALFVARGDVFTAPIEHGITRNLTRSSDAHDRMARWSPDGARIAYVSDAGGEEEIWLIAQDGAGEAEQLTDGSGAGMFFALQWSPDGDMLGYTDKDGRLWVVEVETGQRTEIADQRNGLLGGFAWSPRGGHIALSLNDPSGFGSIYVWSRADGELRRVTGPLFNEFSPAWDPDGDYLFYLSDRQYAPQLGSFEWNYLVNRESYIYALALRDGVAHPFPPRSDEVTIEADGEEEGGGEGEEEAAAGAGEQAAEAGAGQGAEQQGAEPGGQDEDAFITIDFEGLDRRVARVPVDADNYGGLSANDSHLFYFRTDAGYYGRGPSQPPALMAFSMEEREATEFSEGVSGYALSQDGNKILVSAGPRFTLHDAGADGGSGGTPVSTSGLSADVTPRQEYAQIFDEVWRRFRDFFYVENMHGYDWQALRARYRRLLEHVAHRSDLNYILGEMISELSASHTYIAGGDWDVPDRPDVALPGARFELDEQAGRYRIAGIFAGQNEEQRYRSPLTEVGIDVSVGDYVLAVDGEQLAGNDNPYRLLQHKSGPVTLTVNDAPSMEGAREVTYEPVATETGLIYLQWVEKNRRKVEEATNGRVGYLHVPDMGANGIYEFIKWFYGQIRKEGLVIDVRGNGGGNVSSMLIERLRRELLATGFARGNEDASTYPQVVFHGPMVALMNETSASDGDIFPAMFKQAGLGPLIGKRSWGGVIGITSYGPLIDGGQVNVPQFGFADTGGNWIIEGHGVEPDIVVENDPASVIRGEDPQLDRAIQEVMRMIEEGPMALPRRAPDPIKR